MQTAHVSDADVEIDSKEVCKLIRFGDHSWMVPAKEQRATFGKQIYQTYQWIQMKIKLYFIYEELDQSIILTFRELMNYPALPEEYFPKHYFDELLKQLTIDQKQRYLNKYEKLCQATGRPLEIQF